MRAALYARVSTKDKGQNPEMQLTELREFAKARRLDAIICWKLDRFGSRRLPIPTAL